MAEKKKATLISHAYTQRSDGLRLIFTQTPIQAVRINDQNQTTMKQNGPYMYMKGTEQARVTSSTLQGRFQMQQREHSYEAGKSDYGLAEAHR